MYICVVDREGKILLHCNIQDNDLALVRLPGPEAPHPWASAAADDLRVATGRTDDASADEPIG